MEIETKQMVFAIIKRAHLSWNPDNFSELLDLLKLEYPEIDIEGYVSALYENYSPVAQ